MKNKIKLIGWSAIIIVLLFFLLIRITVIEINTNDQKYYLHEDKFELRWIHSVEKEEWVEVYYLSDNQIMLTETFFKTFGAGVPAEGEIIPSTDGYVHMKLNYIYSSLNITVSENVQTTMAAGDKNIKLYQLTEDYDNIEVSVARLTIWEYWKGVFL